MTLKAVLFDLDGTLLPMDQDVFIKAYFGGLVAALSPYGYEPGELVAAIQAGTVAMIKNDGKQTNEEAFWTAMKKVYGERVITDAPRFESFYYAENGFVKVRDRLGYSPMAKEALETVKSLGLRAVLATNPVFPAIATEERIRWAGLSPDDFEHYTTYENSRFCKPSLSYYKDIIQKIGLRADECLMVGNDVGEDMITESLGMKVFLLTDCLINKTEADISRYPHGSFADLIAFLKNLK